MYGDPERQLRHEIQQTWLTSLPEADRDTRPMRDFCLGRDFLTSLDLGMVDRRRALGVAVEILTRDVYKHPGRDTHPLRTSEGGGTPQLTRDDGAAAWRCALKIGTPAAPRMHWWELPDGQVELGNIAHHDDFSLR